MNPAPDSARTIDRAVLTETQLAEALSLSPSWLQHDRMGKRLLPYFKIGGAVRYSMPRVLQAMAALEHGGAALPKRKGAA